MDLDAQVDLTKLKVPDLKKLLKDKGLPTSGNKSDLISRLKEEMPEATGDPDNLEEVLDDSVLNESIDESSQDDEKENAQTTHPAETASEQTTQGVEQPIEKETSPKPTVVKIGGLSDSERLAQRTKKFGAISEDVRKQSRAERFGATAEDDKKKSRAQRFGIVETAEKSTNANISDKEKSSITSVNKDEDKMSKLKKRAARFSAVTNKILRKEEAVEKLKQRAERFGTVTSKTLTKVEGNEKLVKRSERFGVVSPTNTTSSTTTKGDGDEKLLKRKQRFGTPITAPGPEEEVKKKRSEKFNLITPP